MAEPKADGWLAHEREQRRAWLKLTYRQRLEWLWQAKQFAARAFHAVRRYPRPAATPLLEDGGAGVKKPAP